VVYIPKYFFPHAVSLRQAFAHCARFPVAATRRCRSRVSVTLWPAMLSHRLPVIGLVGFYPTNYLIGCRLLSKRLAALSLRTHAVLIGLSASYSPLWGRFLHITHPSAAIPCGIARLACLRHTASVHPEPGSNSQKKRFDLNKKISKFMNKVLNWRSFFNYSYFYTLPFYHHVNFKHGFANC
jgi:hypothetical protein